MVTSDVDCRVEPNIHKVNRHYTLSFLRGGRTYMTQITNTAQTALTLVFYNIYILEIYRFIEPSLTNHLVLSLTFCIATAD